MKLDEITKVKQTSDEDEVNEYLGKGYKVLKILSSRVATESGGEEIKPVYVLGLAKE